MSCRTMQNRRVSPLGLRCSHLNPVPDGGDPVAFGCMAGPGEPCIWVTNGVVQPARGAADAVQFHAERIIASGMGSKPIPESVVEDAAYDAGIL